MIGLQNEFISVLYKSGASFGGSQTLSDNKTIRQCGCGLIAATDLLIYLCKYHEGCGTKVFSAIKPSCISEFTYNNLIRKLRNSYFPVIPHFGMNGLGLMTGVQLFFARHEMPFSCRWRISDKGIWDCVEEMLRADIPVIMAVGPNFPFIWKNGRTMLYTKNETTYVPASSVKAHFICITAMDDQWLEISSWGRRLYLNRRMYEEYVSKYSAPLVSNILYIKKKQGN